MLPGENVIAQMGFLHLEILVFVIKNYQLINNSVLITAEIIKSWKTACVVVWRAFNLMESTAAVLIIYPLMDKFVVIHVALTKRQSTINVNATKASHKMEIHVNARKFSLLMERIALMSVQKTVNKKEVSATVSRHLPKKTMSASVMVFCLRTKSNVFQYVPNIKG